MGNRVLGSLRLNLEVFNAELLKHTRPSKRLNAELKNFNSNKTRITRIKIECLNLLTNFNKRLKLTRSKLRKLRRLLPSIWPSIAKHNKDLRKPKKDPRWLELKCLWPVLVQFSKWESHQDVQYHFKQQATFTTKISKSIGFGNYKVVKIT